MSQFHYQKDDNNVVAVTMDMEGPVNLMDEQNSKPKNNWQGLF